MSVYRYLLKDTMLSSAHFGPCEVCLEPVSAIHHQVEERQYIRGDASRGWTHLDCHDLFGHKECLLALQKPESIGPFPAEPPHRTTEELVEGSVS